MTLFQVISLSLLGGGMLWVIYRAAVRRHRLGVWLLWLVIFGSAFFAVLRPLWIASIARSLGVGRGADLVLYTVAIATLFGFFMFYSKIKRTDREITKLVRYIALQHPVSAKHLVQTIPPSHATPDKQA
ncbi:MAG: DUF2304 domain-containing protein [Myxococcales bacterium]|nr:DUF2304 domain-containing protein [Myxococcales bacterium]